LDRVTIQRRLLLCLYNLGTNTGLKRWDLIAQQYDEMVKYATTMRLGTADAEAILRRFTRSDVQHPTHAALAELGKVRKTIFLCNYSLQLTLHHFTKNSAPRQDG
jgi:TnpA family transposase